MLVSPTVLASTVHYTAPEAQNAPLTIDELIYEASIEYGVSEAVMHHIVKNESAYSPQAIGDKNYYCKRTGQIAPSYGLVQINTGCWHPHVTIEQAYDPEFAITFLAKNLAQGKCHLWSTCPASN